MPRARAETWTCDVPGCPYFGHVFYGRDKIKSHRRRNRNHLRAKATHQGRVRGRRKGDNVAVAAMISSKKYRQARKQARAMIKAQGKVDTAERDHKNLWRDVVFWQREIRRYPRERKPKQSLKKAKEKWEKTVKKGQKLEEKLRAEQVKHGKLIDEAKAAHEAWERAQALL